MKSRRAGGCKSKYLLRNNSQSRSLASANREDRWKACLGAAFAAPMLGSALRGKYDGDLTNRMIIFLKFVQSSCLLVPTTGNTSGLCSAMEFYCGALVCLGSLGSPWYMVYPSLPRPAYDKYKIHEMAPCPTVVESELEANTTSTGSSSPVGAGQYLCTAFLFLFLPWLAYYFDQSYLLRCPSGYLIRWQNAELQRRRAFCGIQPSLSSISEGPSLLRTRTVQAMF